MHATRHLIIDILLSCPREDSTWPKIVTGASTAAAPRQWMKFVVHATTLNYHGGADRMVIRPLHTL